MFGFMEGCDQITTSESNDTDLLINQVDPVAPTFMKVATSIIPLTMIIVIIGIVVNIFKGGIGDF